jgi:hypothetical protein
MLPALLMMKIRSRKERALGDKPFTGPNVATPGGTTGEHLLAAHKVSPAARLCSRKGGMARVSAPIMIVFHVNEGLYYTNHGTVPQVTSHGTLLCK